MIRKRTDGSVLISVVVVLMLAAGAGLALTMTIQDYARMEAKGRDELQAYYAAEAGVLEVVSWFNTSGTVVASTASTLVPLFVRNEEDEYATLAASLPSGGIDIGNDYDESLLPILRDAAGTKRASVTSLKIFPPGDFPQEQARLPYLICVVRSDSVARGGADKRVTLFLCYHNLKLDGAPGAIISQAAIDIDGNVKAHWGEVWSDANMSLPNKSQTPTELEDEWLKFRAQGSLEFASNWQVNKWGVPYHAGGEGDVVDGTDYPCQGVAYGDIGEYASMMEQNQTLDWPNYDYEEVKYLARSKGRYYSTDADGNVYRDGIEDADHLLSDLSELNVEGERGANWANVDYEVIFVDTIDGNEPTTDGANMATLRLSGSGASWKGFYYICANLDVTGMGQPDDIPIKRPDGVYFDKEAFMDGILCVRGAYDGAGNEVVYGSIYAKGGFTGSGTPDVYYNVDLRDGIPFPLYSLVELALWKIEK